MIIFSTGMKSFVYFYFKLYAQIEGANIFSSFFMPLSGRFLFAETVRRSVGTVCGDGPFVSVPLFFV